MGTFFGIDVGTNSVKGISVDKSGRILTSSSNPIPMETPKPGWSQQHPEIWWDAVCIALRELVAKGGGPPSAISVSGQMHSLVAVDAEGKVVYPAILWCDQRTESQCAKVTDLLGGEEKVIGSFGNPVLTGFTLPKILWLAESEPERFKKIKKWMLPKDYIVMKLTGRVVTDFSDASGTSMLDIEGEFDERIPEIIGIDPRSYPELVGSGTIVGTVSSPSLSELEGIPVVNGGADNASSAYGCGVEKIGDAMISIGTSGTVVALTKRGIPDRSGGIHLFRHVTGRDFYHMAVILSATNSLNWFKDRFGNDLSFESLEEMVKQTPAGSDGVVFLPYLNGERTPHRDPSARGTLFGFSSFHSRGDVFRSIYEGVGFALREGAELIESLGSEMNNVRIVGGGSRSETWCQIVADNLGKTIWLPEVDEGAAYGSARLAAEALGIGTSSWIRMKKEFRPNGDVRAVYDNVFSIYKELYPKIRDSYKKISKLQESITK
ncbi:MULTISPECIES: xylulokinase [Mesotoga]|jgi:xylulokinase|uniref:xylulokinase n=1 Tax=Mesotoga TaxID=1184396 RepID=UPI002BCB3D8E|nr:xylulokinase [Mesotoga sp.]HRX65554.1 xylulokinase [Mesotoga sp.]